MSAVLHAIAELPTLGHNGFYVREKGETRTREQDREMLLSRHSLEVEIPWSVLFLTSGLLTVRKTINRRTSSYTYKHIAEDWSKLQPGGPGYIGNGPMIAAAHLIGLDIREDWGPNAWFNIGIGRDFNGTWSDLREPVRFGRRAAQLRPEKHSSPNR